QAGWAAEAGRHDELAARAWTRLMQLYGSRDLRPKQAQALAPHVTAAIERMGGSDELEGLLHLALGQSLHGASQLAQAQQEVERSRSLLERRFGADDLRVVEPLQELGAIAFHK